MAVAWGKRIARRKPVVVAPVMGMRLREGMVAVFAWVVMISLVGPSGAVLERQGYLH
ncbi:MAG: hypothetical protein IID05_04785 [Gemmatimonadetes bacterium]|nr:hypothetical protein [Gemmatimonadota bacterium]